MAKKKKVEDEFIDTKATEEKALNYLKFFIEDSERISQYLAVRNLAGTVIFICIMEREKARRTC